MYNYNPSPEQAKSVLLDAINAGQSLLREENLNNRMFDTWFDYSRKCIQMAFGRNSHNIEANYLDVNMSFLRNNINTPQKLEYCIKFLLDVVRAI
jgi:hypothetical protein